MRALVGLLVLASCGYPALEHTDAGKDGAGGHCDALASYGTALTGQEAVSMMSGDAYGYDGQLTTDMPPDVLDIELFAGHGVFPGAIQPKAIPISGAELDYATCGGCVLIAANCLNCDLSTGAGVGSFYMATSGTLTITALSPLTGSLSNVMFTHVTIDNQGTSPTYHVTPVGDGCVSKIATISFSAPVTPQ